MSYNPVKEKIENICSSVSDFGVLIGPKSEDKRVVGLDAAAGLGMDSDAQQFETTSDDIKKGIFKVLFMGEFKQGKSTLVNAVIGKKAVPTKIVACTAIITVLVRGDKVDRAFVYKKGKAVPEEMSLAEFFKKYQLTLEDEELIEKQGYIDRFADIEYALIESDHSIFEGGVRIIDSPGLGEAVSRNKTTSQFVPSANAIVFLLNAIRPFSKDEKEYIKENFSYKQLKNVFFVVNRVNQITDPIEELMETVEYMLKPVFSDKGGSFNTSLYRKRVFYVNAYGAFMAKEKGNTEELSQTGISEFESELEAFLTSDDRIVATFQSTLTLMANTYKNACAVVDNKKTSLIKPIDELEAAHVKSMLELKGLEERIKTMEKSFSTTSTLVQTKVFQSLINYVSEEMPKMWDEDMSKNEAKFGIGEMLKLAWDSVTTFDKDKRAAKQERIIKPLADSIQKYVMDKIGEWGNTTDILISPEINNLKAELSQEIEQFSLDITKASRTFVGDINFNMINGKAANPFQLGLSLIQGDASVLIENAAGGNFSWGEWIKKYVVQAVMQILIFSMFTGGVGFFVWLAMECIQLCTGASKLKEKLLIGMSEKLFTGLKTAIKNKEGEIKKGMDDKFVEQFNTISLKLRQLIAEEKARQREIINNKKNKQFDIEKELKRSDDIISKLLELIDVVYFEMYNKHITSEEIDRIAKIKATAK